MLRKLRPRSAYDVIALLALFIAVGGGTAFAVVAANQVNSASIIDKQVKARDLADHSIGPFKIKTGGVANANLGPGSVDSGKVSNESLTGTDVNESTLSGIGTGAVFGGNTDNPSLTAVGSVSGTTIYAPPATYNVTVASNVETAVLEAVSPPVPAVARDFAVTYPTATSVSTGHFLKFSLRVGTTTTALSCTIGGATAPAQHACRDTSNSVSIPPETPLKIAIEHTGGTGAVGVGHLRWSWRLLTP
jgi:hypothetical protein